MSLSDRTIYIFTPEVFEVVGSPTITDDGIASGLDGSNYISFSFKENINFKFEFSFTTKQAVFENFLFGGTATNERRYYGYLGSYGLDLRTFKKDGSALVLAKNLHSMILPNTRYFGFIEQTNNKYVVGLKAQGETEYKTTTTVSDFISDIDDVFIRPYGGNNKKELDIDLKQFSISVDGKEVFSGSRKIELGVPVLDDSEHLPKVVTNVLGIDDILLAIDPEVQLLRVDISDLIKELYVKTTDKFIRRWENDFSLPYDSSLTLQQRRQRVLNKLARKKTLTWENLKLLVKNNIDNPQFYIMNDSKNYHFTIMVQTPNYNELTKALDETIPAYLTYDIIVTEYFKRCGTFASGTNPL